MPRRVAVDPVQLVKFFDQPYGAPGTATLSRAPRSRLTYDPSLSWDGLSMDPRPFSRLNAKKMVSSGPRPQGVANGQTIELEDVPKGGIFGSPVRKGPARAKTLEEMSLDFALEQSQGSSDAIDSAAPCLSVSLSRKRKPKREQRVVVMEEERFSNMKMWPPKMQEVVAPDVLFRAGEQTDTLLHPKDRRKIMELERDASKAWQLKKATIKQNLRSDFLLKRQHPVGTVDLGASENPETEIYREQGERLRRRQERRARSAALREAKLSKLLQPSKRYGFDFLSHDAPKVSEKLFQTKGGVRPMLDHDARLFMREEFHWNEKRQQFLRDQDLLGKNYNIVQHTVIETMPSTCPERIDKCLAHPSQASLERGRNLQGSLYGSW
eukprot:scaffold2314_cov267-Pinguiococcus_pyrenoidosus.AAC.8